MSDTSATLQPDLPVHEMVRLLTLSPRLEPDGWWNWDNAREAELRLISELLANVPPYPGPEHGCGIVICGGGKYLLSTYITLRVLRHVGCTLPIEVWHFAGEIDQQARDIFAGLAVHCVDADRLTQIQPFRFLRGHWWKGWQLKLFALLHCPFREVLFLDADCYPVRDPSFLFDTPIYRQHGSIFWTSCAVVQPGLTPEQWHAFGLPPQPDSGAESGQLLLDRRRCWTELNLAAHLNAHADYTYRHVLGDKDTFPIAWRHLRRDYGRLWPTCGLDGPAVLQYDDCGKVLFLHRALAKFTFGSPCFDTTRQRQQPNQRVPHLPLEDFVFAALEQFQAEYRRG